jgi:hypothetical protein
VDRLPFAVQVNDLSDRWSMLHQTQFRPFTGARYLFLGCAIPPLATDARRRVGGVPPEGTQLCDDPGRPTPASGHAPTQELSTISED